MTNRSVVLIAGLAAPISATTPSVVRIDSGTTAGSMNRDLIWVNPIQKIN